MINNDFVAGWSVSERMSASQQRVEGVGALRLRRASSPERPSTNVTTNDHTNPHADDFLQVLGVVTWLPLIPGVIAKSDE